MGLGGPLSSYRHQTSGHPWVPFQGQLTRGRGRGRDPFLPRPPAGPSQTQRLPGDPRVHKSSAFLSTKMSGPVAQWCPTLRPHGLWPSRLLCPWAFSGQEYWSGLPCPPPGGLPNPGMEPRSLASQADALPSGPPGMQTTLCRAQRKGLLKAPPSSNLPGSAVAFTDRFQKPRLASVLPGSACFTGQCEVCDVQTGMLAAFPVTGVKPQGTPGCWGLCAWGHRPQ